MACKAVPQFFDRVMCYPRGLGLAREILIQFVRVTCTTSTFLALTDSGRKDNKITPIFPTMSKRSEHETKEEKME